MVLLDTVASALLIIFMFIMVIVLLTLFIVKAVKRHEKQKYPIKTLRINITNKRIKDLNDAIDYYLINYGKEKIFEHIIFVDKWKKEKIENCKGNQKKIDKLTNKWKEYERKEFVFVFIRERTRYQQRNYVRSAYKVEIIDRTVTASETAILGRIKFLEKTGHLVTYNQYTKEDQRKALTKELREYIKKRDNYTCQICGKYMPDEVGLHVDHIIPIAKGGKSIPQNLRVLCSKCNGRKGSK